MLKKLCLFLILLFCFQTTTIAQFRFGNEWINYDQDYLKLTIDKEGIYLLKKIDLANAGFDVTNLNPRKLQLFYRGKEMAINVAGESDFEFNDDDYIEFYAKPNDGYQDRYVYNPIDSRPHPYINLYGDETAYFLTISNNSLGKRMQNAPNIDTNIINEKSFTAKKIVTFTNQWNWDGINFGPDVYLSDFQQNEGLCSNDFSFNKEPYNFTGNIFLENYAKNDTNKSITFETMLIGKGQNYIQKYIEWSLNGINKNPFLLKGHNIFKVNENIINLFTQDTLQFDFSIKNTTSNFYEQNISSNKPFDAFSVFYYKIEYPRKPIFENNYIYEISKNNLGIAHLRLTNSPKKLNGYNFSDFENQQKLNFQFNEASNEMSIFVGNTSTKQNIYLSDLNLFPKKINLVKFNKINPIDYNYIIITNTILKEGTEAYMAYRKSKQGGAYKVLINEISNIYDEYCFGERNPIAIKRFADYLTNKGEPKYLFLIGKAHSRTNELKTYEQFDLVPTFGYPASDVLLTSGLNDYPDLVSSIPTGRLSVTSNNEIINYLNKVIEHEYLKVGNNWQSNFMHLAGPQYYSERSSFEAELNSLKSIVLKSDLGVFDSNFTTINKSPDVDAQVEVPQQFYDKVNEGVGVITYLGHGSTRSTSHNFGLVSYALSGAGGPLKYNNKGKYPLLYVNGCSAGNSFAKDNSLLADWVNTPNKGAIVGIGTSYLSFEYNVVPFMKKMYETWYNTININGKVSGNNLYESIGNILRLSNKNFYLDYLIPNQSYSQYFVSLLQQTVLFGDPAIAVFKPNAITPLPIKLISFNGKSIDEKNILNWKTAEEKEFEGFEIEKSKDLGIFNSIGFVKSNEKNDKKDNEYQFIDHKNEDFGSYYRLKMKNNNKIDTYSNIIFLQNTIENGLKIYGNPIENNIIKFSMDNLDKNSILLTNEIGQQLNFELTNLSPNNYQIVFDYKFKGVIIIGGSNIFGKKYIKKILNLTN